MEKLNVEKVVVGLGKFKEGIKKVEDDKKTQV
jgi:hypothetical protein